MFPSSITATGNRRGLKAYVSALWNRRELAWFMAKGNIKARHASTALGLFWWVLNPLLLGLVYFLVFGYLLPFGRDIAYLLSGMFVFHFTAQAMNGGATSIVQNSRLIVNVAFPRLLLPISFLLESIFGFFASILVLYAIIIPISGITPGPEILILLVVLPIQVVFNLGLSSLAARLAVPFRDIKNLIVYINRLWLYSSPVIWPLELIDRLPDFFQVIVRLNPMFPMISIYRSGLLGYELDMSMVLVSAIWALVVGVIGVTLFVRFETKMVRHL